MVLLIFQMVTFKKLTTPEDARAFSEILERTGGIYVPETFNKAKYVVGDVKRMVQHWLKEPVLLFKRRKPFEVDIVLLVDPDRLVKGVLAPARNGASQTAMRYLNPMIPGHCFLTLEDTYFSSADRLKELLELGARMYELFSPCYGFISLPWMPSLAVTTSPERGLPGLGWATWLGPEYNEIVQLPPGNGIEIQPMSDGGRQVVLPFPADPRVEDPACLDAHHRVLKYVDPRVLQPEARRSTAVASHSKGQGEHRRRDGNGAVPSVAILPKFRFRG